LSKRFLLLSFLLICFQTYLLLSKYIETINIRERYSSCAAVCEKDDSSNKIENDFSRTSLKNTNLSALIFLNSLSNNYLLYNVGGISELSDREFKKFVEVFTRGRIVNVEMPIKSETLEVIVNGEDTQRISFPWLDIGPANIAKYSISTVEVLGYKENDKTVISYIMVLDEIAEKLIIVDKKLL